MATDWHRNFFRGIALEMWRRATPPEQTRIEVDFLESVLQCSRPAHILDVPSGNGRHSIELANRGWRMTGVDSSPEFIAEAQHTAANGSWQAEFHLRDMRDLPWTGEFDGAFCLGNSFGYLDPSAAAEFVDTVSQSLKPGARFIVDTGMAAESILPALQKGRWHRLGDLYLLSEHRYDPLEGRLDIDYTFIRGGEIETRPSTSYVMSVGEICRLHRAAGLQPVELFGSFDRQPYQLGSPRLILVTQKLGGHKPVETPETTAGVHRLP